MVAFLHFRAPALSSLAKASTISAAARSVWLRVEELFFVILDMVPLQVGSSTMLLDRVLSGVLLEPPPASRHPKTSSSLG